MIKNIRLRYILRESCPRFSIGILGTRILASIQSLLQRPSNYMLGIPEDSTLFKIAKDTKEKALEDF